MSSKYNIENILIQVRVRLQENGVKLWMVPYYIEGIGPVDVELEVSVNSTKQRNCQAISQCHGLYTTRILLSTFIHCISLIDLFIPAIGRRLQRFSWHTISILFSCSE